MKKLLVFLLLFFSMEGLGQNPKLDSVKMVVKGLSMQAVSIQRDSLLTVSIVYIRETIPRNDINLVQFWTDSLRKFSKISRWEQSIAYSHFLNSGFYYYNGFAGLSFKELEFALKLFKKFKNEKMYATSSSNLITMITNFLIVNPLADGATEKKYLNYLLDGFTLAKKEGNVENIANINLCLVQYHIRHKNYKESQKYAIDAWEITKIDTKKYFYTYHAAKASEGLTLLFLGKQKEGFVLLNRIKNICKKSRTEGDQLEQYLLAGIAVYLGNYYIEKKEYQNAIVEAKAGMDILKTLKIASYTYLLNKVFYQAYKNLEKPKEALIYFEKIQAFEQEIQTKEANSQFIEFQLKYEDEKQKNQIQVLENQKLTQTRNVLSLAGLLALGIIGYVFWNNQKLKKKNAEIEQALFKGQTIERKRVAEELHDNLSAKISGIRWRLEAITPHFNGEKEQKIYDSSVNALAEVYTDVRLIAHNLLPAELETKGLVFALEHLIKELNGLDKTKFSLQIPDDLGRFKNKIEYEIFSIILELSNNILKHSQAQNATISLEKMNQKLTLTVADNGVGFEENKDKKGMGMDNLKSRVSTLNGTLKIENQDGVSVEVVVPV